MTLKKLLDKNTELYKTLLVSNTRKIDEYNDANTIKLIDKNTDSINNLFSDINKNKKENHDQNKNLKNAIANKYFLKSLIENQLTQTENYVDNLDNKRNGKYRQVEINKYYSEKYNDKIKISFYFVLFCIGLIILLVLHKFKKLVNPYYVMIIVPYIIIFMFYLLNMLFNSYMHDNMEYNNLRWMFQSPSNKGESIWTYNKKNFIDKIFKGIDDTVDTTINVGAELASGACFGDNCCGENTRWDYNLNKCINK